MAKKCPKNFSKLFKNKSSRQRTLAEAWFFKKISSEKQDEKDKNSFVDQCSRNDSDSAASSQVTTEPKLRKKVKKTFVAKKSARQSISASKKVNQSVKCKPKSKAKSKSNEILPKTPQLLPKKLKTPTSTPKKKNSVAVPSISDEKLNVSDICEMDSSMIKEEIDDMIENVSDFDSVEMKYNLSDLIAGEEFLPNGLESSSTIIKCEANVKDAEESTSEEEQDLLYIDEEEKNRILMEQENSEKNKNISVVKKKRKKQGLLLLKHDQLVVRQGQVVVKKTSPIRRKSKDFSETTLRSLHIKLQHTVPPQHKIENYAGSHPPSKSQILLFENYGPLKRGPYTKFEDETIKQNWTNFSKLHNWDEKCVEPFLNMRHKGKYYIPNIEERKNFVRFLANGLPWRSLYSVYYRFKNLYNFVINGPYTVEEDRKIIKYMCEATSSKTKDKYAVLARALNRKRHSIWQRYQILKVKYGLVRLRSDDSSSSDLTSEEEQKSKSERKRLPPTFIKVYKEVTWSLPLVSRFLDKLMETMSCKGIEDLKNRTIDDEVWKKMERKMSIDQTVLQNFWNLQLHMQLFCPKPLYLNDLKIDLIEYLHKNERNSESIEWNEVKLAFDGVTSNFLSTVFDHLIKDVNIIKLETTDIKIADIIEYLYTAIIPELEEKTRDAVLPKLYHHGGKIIGVNKTGNRPSIGTTANPLSDE